MSSANPRVTGTADFFDRHTGRGQVIGPDHRAYWLHRKELSGISELSTGQLVEFNPTESPRGPRATAVAPVL
jgi:cold shock CspA family protein